MKLKELISVSPGFHRSVNVRLDLENAEKIANYIPTDKSEKVIEHVASALGNQISDGAIMLIGSYGTGKSHLAAFLASVAGKTVPDESFAPVLEKLRHQQTKAQLQALIRDNRHLVVTLSGSTEFSLDQQLLVGLKRALQEQRVDLELQSSYAAALRTIDRWQSHYPVTYGLLCDMLKSTAYSTERDLSDALSIFDSAALQLFLKIYPQLTAGASFDLLSGEVAEVYEGVSLELVRRNYKGIMLVFDEFNKVMDVSIRDGQTLKTMQDLAELASRGDQGFSLNIILISHRTISQYVDSDGSGLADEWRKIEGRFRILDVSNKPWETYDLISRVLCKSSETFYEELASRNPLIEEVAQNRYLQTLYEGIKSRNSGERFCVDEVVLRGCLPLHPVTVFLLPRVSAKLAQNERTLFTFLAGQDGSPLPDALEAELDELVYVLPCQLYDYFEEQLGRSQDQDTKAVWTKVTNALDSLPAEANAEIAVLKTIGMLQVGGNPQNLPCTLGLLEYALSGQDVSEAIAALVQRKLIFVKQSTGEVDIVEPADFDVEEAIEGWMQERSPAQSAFELLGQLRTNYVIPQRHNHEKKMTRFLSGVYLGLNDLQSTLPEGWLAPQFDGLDGVICYLFPESPQELTAMAEMARAVQDPRALLALPKKPIQIRAAIMRSAALTHITQCLREGGADARVLHLADLYLQDARQDLDNKLAALIVASPNLRYFHGGQEFTGISEQRELSNKCSDILDQVYGQAPIINNELINKANPTLTSRRARNDVIDALLSEREELRASLRSAQERFMLDTLYVETGLFDSQCSRVNTSWPERFTVLKAIEEYFKGAGEEPLSFDPLLRRLYAPPYGVRAGVTPAILAACIVKLKHYVTIKDASGRDCQIEATLLDKIIQNPGDYFVKLEEWNPALEKLTTGLAETFGRGRPDDVFFANRFGELGYEVFRWFSALPRYARETRKISSRAQMLRRVAKVASHRPRQSLLADLPKALGFGEVSEEHVVAILGAVRDDKVEIEGALSRLINTVKQRLADFLLSFGTTQESLVSLARNMVQILTAKGVSSEWGNLVAYTEAFEGYDDEEFAAGLIHKLTGIRLEDWLDSTESDMEAALANIQRATEQAAAANQDGPRIELAFHESTSSEKVVMQLCEVSDLGEMLQAHLESAIDNFGDAISPLEKRQILLNILRKSL